MQVVVKAHLSMIKDNFLTTSAIESSINFLPAGRTSIINKSLVPDHSSQAI